MTATETETAPCTLTITPPADDPLTLLTRDLFAVFERYGLFAGSSVLQCEGGVSRSVIDEDPGVDDKGQKWARKRNGPHLRISMTVTDTTNPDDVVAGYFTTDREAATPTSDFPPAAA